MTDDELRDELLAERLRRALAEEAEQVQPAGDGLSRIRSRTAARRSRAWWSRPPSLALGTAAVASVVAVAALFSLDGDGTGGDLPAATSVTPRTPAATPSASASPSVTAQATPDRTASPATSTATAGDGGTPPAVTGRNTSTMMTTVYYLGDGRTGKAVGALYRERRRVPYDPGVVRVAVRELLGGRPHDDDYDNLWPAGTVLGANLTGDRIVLDLSESVTQRSASAEATRLSLQQLVYTATEAAGDPSRVVDLRIAGKPVTWLWGNRVGKLVRADPAEVLAPVWITAPADGETVGRTVTMAGEATVYEATVAWEIRRGSKLVQNGYATAELGAPGRGTWRQRLTLPPGSYQVQAFEVSPKDGSRQALDSKRITVK
jgi:hypothetical protein